MKILYSLHQFFPYYYTGTEVFTLNIASYIKKMSNKPTIVSYLPNNRKTEIILKNINDIDTYHLGLESENFSRDIGLNNEITKNQLKEIIKKVKPDIIHITHLSRIASISEIALELKIPYIITLTDFWTICPRATLLLPSNSNCSGPDNGKKCGKYCFSKIDYNFEDRLNKIQNILNKARYVVYASGNLFDILNKNINLPQKKMIQIRHGYNATKILPKKKGGVFNFAYIGSLNIHKGAHIVIKAFKKIVNNNIRLNIYGNLKDDPGYSKYMQNLAKKDHRISFKGTYPKEDTAKIFSEINVIIIPSIWRETYPFVAITALSYNTPVIGSNIGGIPEILKEKTLLFKPGNPDDLEEKMAYLLNEKHYKELSEKCFYNQRIENEGFEYEKLYESIITNRS